MKTRTIICWILLLIAIDQAVKLIIYTWFMDVRFDIISPLFYFEPFFNDKHSYVNNLLYNYFNINIGFWPHIVIFLLAQYIVLAIYCSFRSITTKTTLLDTALIFEVAAMVCALLGNICWKEGTLDFIYLKPLYIFDLKDIYINTFVCLLLIYSYRYRHEISKITAKELFTFGLFRNKSTKME